VTQLLRLDGLAARPGRGLESLATDLETLRQQLFTRGRMTLNLTCAGPFAEKAGPVLERFWAALPARSAPAAGSPAGAAAGTPALLPAGDSRLEALLTTTNVNFAAVAIQAAAFGSTESMQEAVLAHYLSTGFLWERVRMQGGAYGASASVSSLERLFTFSSYRDPNIASTFAAFREALAAAHATRLSPEAFEQVLIGAVGKEDRPMAPGEKGFVAFKRSLLGITDSLRQLRRDRLLAAGPGDLEAAAGRLEQALAGGFAAVVASRQAMEQSGQTGYTRVELPD